MTDQILDGLVPHTRPSSTRPGRRLRSPTAPGRDDDVCPRCGVAEVNSQDRVAGELPGPCSTCLAEIDFRLTVWPSRKIRRRIFAGELIDAEIPAAGPGAEKEEGPPGGAGGPSQNQSAMQLPGDYHGASAGQGFSSRRQRRNFRPRVPVFVTAAGGIGIGPAGEFRWRGGKSVSALLRALPAAVDRVVLVGQAATAEEFRAWAMPRSLPPMWSHGRHYLNRADRSPVLHYRGPAGVVEVIRAAAYFGEGAYTPGEAAAAYAELGELLAGAFDGLPVLTSPATTGRQAWLRTIPRDREYPVLEPELAGLIRDTSGQGRIEFPRAGQQVPELHCLDGRFMYAALCWGLPSGNVEHDNGAEYLGQTRARYRIEFRVPADWDHVGLLPVKGAGGTWEYPAGPSTIHETWVDGAELGLALKQGWHADIRERIYWPEPAAAAGDPLKNWAEKLQRLRDNASPLVAAAIRNILLHGLGAFYGRPHAVTNSCPASEPGRVPAGATAWLEGSALVWEEHEPAPWPELVHPEWPAAVWARCRARLLDGPAGGGQRAGALHVPRDAVAAFLTDAIYLTADPGWPDDGKAGRFRHKGSWTGPFTAPATVPALRGLVS